MAAGTISTSALPPAKGKEHSAANAMTPIAILARGRQRRRALLGGHHERADGVQGEPEAAEEGQHHEPDADEGGVEAEVVGDTTGDAGDAAITGRAPEAAGRGSFGGGHGGHTHAPPVPCLSGMPPRAPARVAWRWI